MARKTAPKSIKLHQASKTKQAMVFRAINNVLREQGIASRVQALHLTAAAAKEDDTGAPCPPNQILKTICEKQPDGTIVCKEECVPI